MTIQDIRRNRLKQWLEGKSVPAKEKSYFSQLVTGTASFGERAARRLERDYGMGEGYLDWAHTSEHFDAPKKAGKPGVVAGSGEKKLGNIGKDSRKPFDKNVAIAEIGQREVPVISYVQAALMTEVSDPFALGEGFEKLMTDVDVSRSAFALLVEGESMLPEYRPGDKIIIDPILAPVPGDCVVATNRDDEATFKKYRPRGTGENGQPVFELVPLNDDFATLHSERDHLRIIGVMVEHRKYRAKR